MTLTQDGYVIRIAMDNGSVGATSTVFDATGAQIESHHVDLPQGAAGTSMVDNADGTFSIVVGSSKFTWRPLASDPAAPPTSGTLTTDNGTFGVALTTAAPAPTNPGTVAPATLHAASVNLFGWIGIGIAAADALCHYFIVRLRNQCNAIGCVFTDQGSCGPPFHNQLNTDCACPPGAGGHWEWPKVKVVVRDMKIVEGART